MKTKHAWIFAAVGVIALALSIVVPALSQSNPGFVTGQVPTAAQWNSYFGRKLDYQSTGAYPSVVSVGPLTQPLVITGNAVAGQAAPATNYLQITGANGAGSSVAIDTYLNGVTTVRPGIFLRSYGGIPATPTAVGNDQSLGYLGFRGYDGVAEAGSNVLLSATTTQAFTGSAHGTKFIVETTANGATTRRPTLVVGQDGSLGVLGRVSVGTIDPSGSGGSGIYYSGTDVSSGSGAGFNASPTWASASLTTSGSAFASYVNITGTSTVPLLTGYLALGGTQAGASTVSAYSGFDAFSLPTGGTLTLAAGFRGRYAAASNVYNLYMDGTAKNYLAGALSLGSSALTISAGGVGLKVITAPGVAPGAAGAGIYAVCGTGAGTAKLIVYAGTSTTPSTVVDNVGGGVTGC